ncbi:spondin-2-like [Callorhinchus milii]|uniref:spondin-2-like n=1 Tax=Callorhinchus milii TaxID=7868 RepID=UPI001C3F8E76|nr:spondin-2-like [Callorhinchus milii]
MYPSTSLLLLIASSFSLVQASNRTLCRAEEPANYSVKFSAEWNTLSFPKQYPTHRPPAQWSLLFGCVHSDDFTLWAEGDMASAGVKLFAEDGNPDLLLEEVNITEVVFTADPITLGEGNTCTMLTATPSHPLKLYAHGDFSLVRGLLKAMMGLCASQTRLIKITLPIKAVNYSKETVPAQWKAIRIGMRFRLGSNNKVSFLVRVIPSPDWFLGASRVNLCEGDEWRESISLDLFPWDAGTDSGFTFSSPNFPTSPQEPVFKITAKHPSHPVNSFFYPRLESLPRMGHLELSLLSAAQRGEGMDKAGDNSMEYVPANQTLARNGTSKAWEEMAKPGGVSNEVLSKEADKDSAETWRKGLNTTPLDCEVSNWSTWGLCSHRCGISTRQRTRYIVQLPANAGDPCPALLIQENCEEVKCPMPTADPNLTTQRPQGAGNTEPSQTSTSDPPAWSPNQTQPVIRDPTTEPPLPPGHTTH